MHDVVLRIFFSGLMAFVPSKDGKELTVLVVNTSHAMKLAVKRELALHNPALLESVLKMINAMSGDATAGIEAFITAWTSSRDQISAAVGKLYPIGRGLQRKAR